MLDYRIEFSIQGRGPDDEDFTEIGFGSSCAHASVGAAAYEVQSIIENHQWETTAGMPSPDETREEADVRAFH